ncbi:MAG: DUF4249 family protein [Saprospiraceae bacterium]|nr:DUF4249 family protein [Saprospiraceae bacterium]
MKKKYYILLFLPLFMGSCLEEYIPEVEPTDQKLVAVAELEANELGFIRIGTTFGVNTPEIELDHDISVIKIINFEENNNPEEFRYDYVLQAYKNLDFKPKEGRIYELSVDARIPGLRVMRAQTLVPYSTKINSLEDKIIPAKITDSQGNERSLFDITVDIEPNLNEDQYFHLIPYIDDNNPLTISKINSQENAVSVLSHRDGMLIDMTKMSNDNRLSFSLKTLSELEVSGTDPSYMFFELRTITEDYYHYHLALSRQSATAAGPYTLPVTTYTNIDNGYGLFAFYVTERDSSLIQ